MRHPAKPPDFRKGLDRLDAKNLSLAISEAAEGGSGTYDHWDKVRFRPPIATLTAEETWIGIKYKRMTARHALPFFGTDRKRFTFTQLGTAQQALHEIDSNARGLIGMPEKAATAENRDFYLQKSLVEEPFSSSVLEGAATTREMAQKMIEEGREPKTVSDRMVMNNYRAMSFIREHRDEPLTPARILELHRLLTIDTLDRPEKAGVLRAADDDVRVVDTVSGETLHMPPPAEDLPARLQTLCDFANEPTVGKNGRFLHPVFRAIVLHFMLAYDHPFWDGNGRCARALFYWCVLKHGYWMLEYVSISAVIMRAPVQYGMAFLYTESDDGDVTYFIDHQLNIIQRALHDLRDYLAGKTQELNRLGKALGDLETILNRRQLSLIQYALEHPAVKHTITQHQTSHSVSYLTARADLEELAGMKLLNKTKDGAKSVFLVPANLKERLGVAPKRGKPRKI